MPHKLFRNHRKIKTKKIFIMPSFFIESDIIISTFDESLIEVLIALL